MEAKHWSHQNDIFLIKEIIKNKPESEWLPYIEYELLLEHIVQSFPATKVEDEFEVRTLPQVQLVRPRMEYWWSPVPRQYSMHMLET